VSSLSAGARWSAAILFGALQGLTFAFAAEEAGDSAPWNEAEVALPAMPKADGIELYVTAAATNRFFVDTASVSLGTDGVVRYVITVRSNAGASSINFEGIRCATHERRLYAFGRPDQSWSRAKTSNWTRISSVGANRYAYVLMREYLCPNGSAVRSAEEGVDALRRGGHPSVQVAPGS
jgi:hypothetical protein